MKFLLHKCYYKSAITLHFRINKCGIWISIAFLYMTKMQFSCVFEKKKIYKNAISLPFCKTSLNYCRFVNHDRIQKRNISRKIYKIAYIQNVKLIQICKILHLCTEDLYKSAINFWNFLIIITNYLYFGSWVLSFMCCASYY